MVVLEARNRPGGRVEQTELADGRLVQLGGEVVGPFHEAYFGLVEELGLTLVPSFPQLPGEDTCVMTDSRTIGDHFPWMSEADRASYDAAGEAFGRLAATVDPDDPWSHPDADRLDRLSVGQWLREVGRHAERGEGTRGVDARPVGRVGGAHLAAVGPAQGGRGWRQGLLRLRGLGVHAGGGGIGHSGAPHGRRARPPRALRHAGDQRPGVTRRARRVTTSTGELFECSAVVCAIPVGPLRRIAIDGVSPERLASLDRQRHALAAKVVFAYESSWWEEQGQNGTMYFEKGMMGGTWPQREGILSALVPPERLGAFLATSPALIQQDMLAEMVEAMGERAATPQAVFFRRWGVDPWTEGYITSWRPGDVMAVGPLHGTHDPPFYVCGSDQWVCGYMEGAVRTGRGAARAVLSDG